MKWKAQDSSHCISAAGTKFFHKTSKSNAFIQEFMNKNVEIDYLIYQTNLSVGNLTQVYRIYEIILPLTRVHMAYKWLMWRRFCGLENI